MKSIFLGLLLFFLCTKVSIGQTDNVGSGRAVEFDGVDDYIEFGNRYSDLTFPFTISAWVYLKPSSRSSPIFVSRNNDPLYSGFWFTTYSDFIFIEYGDGFGGNNPAFRRGKKANVTGMTGRWNHVSAVVRGLSDIDIYLNGVNVGNETTGDSNSPMNSNISGGHSTAGYFLSNGVTYNCTGIIDDIRLWNKALSQEEIRKTMCVNLIGNESGLIGYWDFNEISGDTIYDKSSNKFHGKFIGNPTRVFSGAPIGDVSTFQYSTAWSGKTISLVDGDHKIDVKKINGNVEGIQIYEVKNAPSQATGLDLNSANKPYFGVFLVSQNAGATFDANYYFQGNGSCELFLREDNSISVWAEADNPVINKLERGEFEKGFGNEADFELGANKILCDQSSYEISTGIIDPQFTFQWNTGQNTSSIAVSETGLYSVDVFGYCGTTRDSITINFEKTPKAFSLGDDSELCVFVPKVLQPINDSNGLTFLWQDGSTNPTFKTDSYGKFWVTIKNYCGQESDSIVFSKLRFPTDKIPNVIIPNGDDLNDIFTLDDDIVGLISLRVFNRWGEEVYYSPAYENNWGGGDLSSGVYYIVLEGNCIEKTKGTLHIIK